MPLFDQNVLILLWMKGPKILTSYASNLEAIVWHHQMLNQRNHQEHHLAGKLLLLLHQKELHCAHLTEREIS